jgi:hypothetical protein
MLGFKYDGIRVNRELVSCNPLGPRGHGEYSEFLRMADRVGLRRSAQHHGAQVLR